MILKFLAEKDTFVTNLNTQFNEGILANFGNAATLDLFKLYNENENSNSWAKFKFDEVNPLQHNDILTLTDSLSNTVHFKINTESGVLDGSTDADGNVIVGLNGVNITDYARSFNNVINNVSSNDQNDIYLDITAYYYDNYLILKQNKKGKRGDTVFVLPTNMSHINSSENNFSRIDYSCILIKFKLDELTSNKWAKNNNDVNSAFGAGKINAKIILKDVSTGIQKPKGYTLDIHKIIIDDFIEGIGKDVKSFSDSHMTNFKNYNETTSWSIPGIISSAEINDSTIIDSVKVISGDEDIEFNITSYIEDYLVPPAPDRENNFGFLIKFSENNLFDNKSYFAKRLGSRHLSNKNNVPNLDLSINDAEFIQHNENNIINVNHTETESFYYRNSDLSFPGSYNTINFNLSFEHNKQIIDIYNSYHKSGTDSFTDIVDVVYNFQGDTLYSQLKFDISHSNFINNNILDILNKKTENIIKIKKEIYYTKIDDIAKTAGNFIIGKSYKIVSTSDGAGGEETDFTQIGAIDNNAGTIFISTDIGTGTGVALEIDVIDTTLNKYVIDTKEYYLMYNKNTSVLKDIKDIYVTSYFNKDLTGDNNGYSITTYFVDRRKNEMSARIPIDIVSENFGDVYYSLYDVDTNEVLTEYEDISHGTLMKYIDNSYKTQIFMSEIFKNKRINIKYRFSDKNNIKHIVFNKNMSFKVL